MDYKLTDLTHEVSGKGELIAHSNPEGLIALEIDVEYQGRHWAERIQQRFAPTESIRFRLARHENQDEAAFRLSSYIPSLPPAKTDDVP